MNRPPKNHAEAVSLPEMSWRELMGAYLGGAGIGGDDIIAFVDDDGISKKVECIRRDKSGPDEWVKVRL